MVSISMYYNSIKNKKKNYDDNTTKNKSRLINFHNLHSILFLHTSLSRKKRIVTITPYRFTEKPTDAPRTMFISKDQWVEEGGEVRLYCEALIGKFTNSQW